VLGAACGPKAQGDPQTRADTAPAPPASKNTPSTAPGTPPIGDTSAPAPIEDTATPSQAPSLPLQRRFATPGTVRFTLPFPAPISQMHITPLGGLVLSSGDHIFNVTSRGVIRWKIMAGPEHTAYPYQQTELLWSRSYQRLNNILPAGRTGWARAIHGELRADDTGQLYLFDAATLGALAPDGSDRWRAVMNEYRQLQGPWHCDEGIVVQGSRGLSGAAILLSHHGAVIRRIELARGAIVLGVSRQCEPLIWRSDKTALLDARGAERWSVPSPVMPSMKRTEANIWLTIETPPQGVWLKGWHPDGRSIRTTALPIDDKIIGMDLLSQDDRVSLLGLCVGVASHCARPQGNRGPFNTLLAPNAHGGLSVVVRSTHGHAAFVDYGPKGHLIADAASDRETELTMYNTAGQILWTTLLPGRLCAQPVRGPYEALYVATCEGWQCDGPHRLIAITDDVPPLDSTP